MTGIIDAANDLADLIEAGAGHWVMIDGHPILIGGSAGGSRNQKSSTISKVEIAKLAHAGGDKHHQDIAEQMENHLSEKLGMPKSPDNRPFGLQTKTTGVEVKTLVSNTNDKITMSKEAIARKNAEVKASGLKKTFTVVVDARGDKPKYFVREGFGSFRIGSMTSVSDTNGLRKFMGLQ